MITFKKKDLDYSGTKDRIEGECLSTDTKPTTYANGSCLIEMDTGNKFMYDEANATWLNITNPGGGGGAEVWFTGNEYTDGDAGRQFTLTDDGRATELYTNAENYQVFVNNEEFTTFSQGPGYAVWANNDNYDHEFDIDYDEEHESYTLRVIYVDTSTAPTSVEVSVKAK